MTEPPGSGVLIKAGTFDHLGNNRHSHVEAVEGILKSIETDSRRNLDGQLDLFSVMSGEAQSVLPRITMK